MGIINKNNYIQITTYTDYESELTKFDKVANMIPLKKLLVVLKVIQF
jgi:hypothetical protein